MLKKETECRSGLALLLFFLMYTFPSYCALAGSGATFGLGFHLCICGKKTTTSSICFFFLVFVLEKTKEFHLFLEG